MALRAFPGLPLPLTLEEVDTRFTTMVQSAIGTVPIQSQHLGNCASDSIQIVMFFSDYIGKSYRQQAVDLYNRYGEDVFALRPPETSLTNLYEAYRINSIQRFLKLVASLHRKAAPVPGSFAMVRRSASNRNEYAEQHGKHEEYGVECSLLIGKIGIMGRRVDPSLRGQYHSYSYRPDVYNPLKNYLMSKVGPGRAEMVIGTGDLRRDRQLVLGSGFLGAGAGSRRQFVGVQVFLNENRADGYFHTFTLIKINGGWYIGDNEVGLLSPRTPFTDDDILNNTIRIDSVLTRGAFASVTTHQRTYTMARHTMTLDYRGTGTGVPYANAVETAYTRPGPSTSWAVRTYFVYTPPQERAVPMDVNNSVVAPSAPRRAIGRNAMDVNNSVVAPSVPRRAVGRNAMDVNNSAPAPVRNAMEVNGALVAAGAGPEAYRPRAPAFGRPIGFSMPFSASPYRNFPPGRYGGRRKTNRRRSTRKGSKKQTKKH